MIIIKTFLYDLRLSFLRTTSNLCFRDVLILACCVRASLWVLMGLVCAILPSHNPGDDVVRFPHDNTANNCFSQVNTFCECGFDCQWTDSYNNSDENCFEKRNGPENVLQSHVYPFLLRPLTRWDAARFLRLTLQPQLWQPHPVMRHDHESSEQAHAFFPFFPFVVQHMAQLLRYALPDAMLPSTCASLLVLSAWIVNTLCFFVALVSLYQTTLLMLRQHGVDPSMSRQYANRVAWLFVLNPASVFFCTAYSEALFAALIFGGSYGMLLWGPWGAVIPWCLATATRSNSILYFGYLLLYGVGTVLQTDKTVVSRLYNLLVTLCAGLLIVYSIYRHNHTAIVSHCDTEHIAAEFEWCPEARQSNRSFFYLYSYIQRKHWNVGLFRYYHWKQIPNFLLAAPILVLSGTGVAGWCRRSWERAVSFDQKPLLGQVMVWVVESLRDFGKGGSNNKQKSARTGPVDNDVTRLDAIEDVLVGRRVLGHYAVWAVAALLGLTTAHVQISTRLLCSSCPALYWYVTYLVSKSERWGSIYLAYCLLYIVLGGILHPLWLPWT